MPVWKLRRGNYSILMGVSVFTILGFAALAIDISLITMAELQIQATADAASHAALVAYRHSGTPNPQVEGDAAATFMLRRNPVVTGRATLDVVRYGTYNRMTSTFCENCSSTGNVNAVELEISREGGNAIDLLLAPMFGVNHYDVDARSITAQQERAIVLVQDLSCSMMGTGTPAAIDVSRQASWMFLDYMISNPQDGDMLGLAGYADWAAVEGGGENDQVGDKNPWARLVEIAPNVDYLKGRFKLICNTEYGCIEDELTGTSPSDIGPDEDDIGRRTNPASAMRQAIHQLTTKTDSTVFRGMVVMSDGVFNFPSTGPQDAIDAANLAFNVFDIHIWTILFYNGGFDQSQMEGLTRGLGFFQFSPDSADLPLMYATVAEALPTAIVD